MFFARKEPQTNVKSTFNDRLLEVETELIKLKTKINAIELENDDLRNKVLRKIQKKASAEDDNSSASFVLGGAVKRRN